MAKDPAEADRRNEVDKIVLEIAIIVAAAIAGAAWASLAYPNLNQPATLGGFIGFLVGVILTLTARLAAKR